MHTKFPYYLLSYEECRAICDKYEDYQFYDLVSHVDGYKIVAFNYRMIEYKDFLYPLGEDSPIKSFEMRGICFVFNTDGSLYKRYLLMNKFFNLNQVPETQFDLIKDIPIKQVHEKADGSVVSFIRLPNGKILAKTKMCVDNNQAEWAMDVYNKDENIQELVKWALDADIVPVFEFISPRNRVVVKYNKSELVLLKLRDNQTGEYLDLETYPKLKNVNSAIPANYSKWEDLIASVDSEKETEGWVVTLENNMLVKIKTKWYTDLHFTLTETVHREDYLIEKAVDEQMDDLIVLIAPDDEEILALIDNVSNVVREYIKKASKIVEDKIKDFNDNYSSRKDYVQNYGKRDKYFGYVMTVLDGKDTPYSVVARELKKNTYFLERAREFIRTGDFK